MARVPASSHASLALYQRLGNRLGEAKVQHNLAALAEAQGRYADVLEHAEKALRLYQAIGDKASEAAALNNVGWTHGLLGDYEQARGFCRQALALCTEVGHHWLEGYVWDSLGYAEHHLGNLGEAAACYQRALSLHREAGDRFTEAEALDPPRRDLPGRRQAHAGPGGLAAGARSSSTTCGITTQPTRSAPCSRAPTVALPRTRRRPSESEESEPKLPG